MRHYHFDDDDDDYIPDIEEQIVRRRVGINARRNKRFIRNHTLFSEEVPPLMQKEKIFLGVSDFEDFLKTEIISDRFKQGKSSFFRKATLLASHKQWDEWMEKHYEQYRVTSIGEASGLILNDETKNFLFYYISSNSVDVKLHGDKEFVGKELERISEHFTVIDSYIEWIYGGDGRSVNVPLNRDRMPTKEMYPFLGEESLESYYDRYLKSSANILLLIGPPGTGKTTFIRGFLAHAQTSAYVTYDTDILKKDTLFARFIESDSGAMVIEDSDAFLKARTDGNSMMHRFLNVGDGLVTTKGKKMIFSTNLPSIRDIDEALIRPGRCFDILNFDDLNSTQAETLANKLHLEYNKGKDKYSLAELFNEEIKKKTTSAKFGFI